MGGQFQRYFCPHSTHEYLLYITSDFEPKKAKNIYDYLSKHKKLLIEKSVEKKNELVYKLYELTPEEIKIVEGEK